MTTNNLKNGIEPSIQTSLILISRWIIKDVQQHNTGLIIYPSALNFTEIVNYLSKINYGSEKRTGRGENKSRLTIQR
jgi:hypothetical protein